MNNCLFGRLAGLLLFAFVNATTQLISTRRRFAHRAHRGVASTAFTHVFVAVIPHTCTHARTYTHAHARTLTHGRRNEQMRGGHTGCTALLLLQLLLAKEVGGRAVTTKIRQQLALSLSSGAQCLPLLLLPLVVCRFLWFACCLPSTNNIQITLFLYINLISYFARTHTRCVKSRFTDSGFCWL